MERLHGRDQRSAFWFNYLGPVGFPLCGLILTVFVPLNWSDLYLSIRNEKLISAFNNVELMTLTHFLQDRAKRRNVGEDCNLANTIRRLTVQQRVSERALDTDIKLVSIKIKGKWEYLNCSILISKGKGDETGTLQQQCTFPCVLYFNP